MDEEMNLDVYTPEDAEGTEEEVTLVLTDDDGAEVEFEYIDSIVYEGDEYVVLLPAEEDEEGSAEVLILKVEPNEEDAEEEQYVTVESEELLDTLFELFKQSHAEDFDFIEE